MTDWTPESTDPEIPDPVDELAHPSVYDGPTTEQWQPQLSPPTVADHDLPANHDLPVNHGVTSDSWTDTVSQPPAPTPEPPAMPVEPPVLGDTGTVAYPTNPAPPPPQAVPLGPPVIDDRPAPPYASAGTYGTGHGMAMPATDGVAPAMGPVGATVAVEAAKPRKWRRRLALLTAMVVGSVLLFGGGFFIGQFLQQEDDSVDEAIARTEQASATDEDLELPATTALATPLQTIPAQTNAPEIDPGVEPVAAVAMAVGPAVVQIETNFGVGSGFVYNEDGYILTAAHVVENATQVRVRLQNGAVVEGQLVGTASDADVAVVKIDAIDDLPLAPLAIDYTPQVGQLAVAIGSPFGLDQTVTAGIVSAVNRSITPQNIVPLIQTDAAINSGNSGGALVDREGRVIGINVSIQTTSGGNQGVGFAVPIDIAFKIAQRLVAGEEIIWPLLGVGPSATLVPGQGGAVVGTVSAGSGASSAGLRPGDRIVAVDGIEIDSFGELRSSVLLQSPGTSVELEIIRDGENLTARATLGELQN